MAATGLPRETLEVLVETYGRGYGRVLDLARKVPGRRRAPVPDRTRTIVAQLHHAVREEMAVSLQDVLLRRTGIGQSACLGLDCAEAHRPAHGRPPRVGTRAGWTRSSALPPARRAQPSLPHQVISRLSDEPLVTAPAARPEPDRIALEVIGGALSTIAEEMGTALIRASYSANVKERRDCSTAVFDATGRVIAQAEHIPMHLGSLLGVVGEVLARYPAADLAPGDVFIANDPYAGGGTHLPDINLVSPVFAGGALAAFVANIAHHADRTGARIRTVWDEGIRITPIRLYEGGALREDVMELLLANFALPAERRGDLRAQLAANRLGERRLGELIGHHGLPAFRAASDAALAYAERKLRSAVAALPDGVYRFADALDGDGVRDAPIPIAVAITVAGDRIALDFAGSGPQCAGDINAVWLALLATVYYALKALLDPTIPPNGGFYRAIEVSAPEGSIVNARAAGAGRAAPADLPARGRRDLRRARAAVPGRVAAAGNGTTTWMFSGIDPRTRRPYIYLETHGGGAGATAAGPGLDAVQVHLTNTSNLPIECLEAEYPLLVEEYALAEDSGGAGRCAGGTASAAPSRCSTTRRASSPRASARAWRRGAWPAAGPAIPPRLTLNPGSAAEQPLPPKIWDQRLGPGDRVRITTAGGGGYGAA